MDVVLIKYCLINHLTIMGTISNLLLCMIYGYGWDSPGDFFWILSIRNDPDVFICLSDRQWWMSARHSHSSPSVLSLSNRLAGSVPHMAIGPVFQHEKRTFKICYGSGLDPTPFLLHHFPWSQQVTRSAQIKRKQRDKTWESQSSQNLSLSIGIKSRVEIWTQLSRRQVVLTFQQYHIMFSV